MTKSENEDQLVLYGHRFASRLLLGTARYESPRQLADAIRVGDPCLLTVSLRRQLPGANDAGRSFWNLLRAVQAIMNAGCEVLMPLGCPNRHWPGIA